MSAPVFPLLFLGLLAAYALVNLPVAFALMAWFAVVFVGMGALVLAILDRRGPIAVASAPPPLPGERGAPTI